jgi:hypothetical protein
MTVQTGRNELASATRRRLVVLGLLRALATAVVLVALYYLLPLDHITSVPLGLAGGLLILLAVIACQLRAIVRPKSQPCGPSWPWPARCRCSSGPCSAAGSRRLRPPDRVSRQSRHDSTAMG